MLHWIIDFSLRNRLLILLLSGLMAAIGVVSLARLPIDAFPDTTPVQVQINTTAPSLNPLEIEQRITLPIELAMGGLPGLDNVRSVSKFGFSQVVATFDDTISVLAARQLIGERLQTAELPETGARPELGPISSGLGEIFHYVVRSENPDRTLTELRELHDWVIRPELRKVRGVAEINSWGGFEKQFHVVIEPGRLVQYGLRLQEVFEALEANNRSVGGGQIVRSGESLLVHGVGLATNRQQIANIVIRAHDGVPLRVGDVAEVEIGHEIRRGAVTADGNGEVVLGLGFMLLGENSRVVARALKMKLAEAQSALPPDVIVEPVYDRTELVDMVLKTVRGNLLAGALLVIAVLFAALGNFRAGLIVAAAIPLSMLFAGNLMLRTGIAASLLSLGALDFGLIVDSSVIMVENCARHLGRRSGKPRLQVVRDAAIEVRKPTLFGELIIMIVFLPILTLEGVEGKMFRPMALTMVFALAGSLIFSLTLMPVLASFFLPQKMRSQEPWLMRVARRIYRPVLGRAMRFGGLTLGVAVLAVVLAGAVASKLGGEFMPRLHEGAIVINVIRLAGVSLEESVAGNTRIERLLLEEFPDELARVWSRIGTAEVATDPMGIELTDIFVALKSRGNWTKAATQQELVNAMDELLGDVPGLNMVFTQPIEMRMNEMVAGIRSDLGIKIYGDDFAELTRISDAIQRVLPRIRGAAEMAGEQLDGQPVLRVEIRPEAIGRQGIPARDVLDLVEIVGNRKVGEVREGQRRFPLMVRLPERQRSDPDALAATLIPSGSGAVLRLDQLATLVETEGPATIPREWSRRRMTVQANVRGRDVGGFVSEAQRRIREEAPLPEGYTLEWGGQFEQMERAYRRLLFVAPLTIGLVLSLLYFSLGSVRDVLLVATGIPFGAVGGIAALAMRDMPFTISAAIGFVALSGIAMLNGLVLVTFIKQRFASGIRGERAVMEACEVRLRPVLMTALVAAVGFIPMALNMGIGAEVQRPLATVVIGGIVSDTVLTLLVFPVLYSWASRSPSSH